MFVVFNFQPDEEEEDLSQYPLATANGSFTRDDFFDSKEKVQPQKIDGNEYLGQLHLMVE